MQTIALLSPTDPAPSCETSSIIQLDQSPPPRKKLSSLSEWSIERIKAVFEGSNSANNSGDEDDNDNEGSESKVRAAISATFADTVVVTANGSPLPREDIDLLVLAMRRSSVDPTTGLNVEWKRAEDIPRDPQTNRDGALSGAYVIRGLRNRLPGSDQIVNCERHKTVHVIIESQSSDPDIDSRRIVNLTFEATDVTADHTVLES